MPDATSGLVWTNGKQRGSIRLDGLHHIARVATIREHPVATSIPFEARWLYWLSVIFVCLNALLFFVFFTISVL
jgi:hypothetical protein